MNRKQMRRQPTGVRGASIPRASTSEMRRRTNRRLVCILFSLALLAGALLPVSAQALTTRTHLESFEMDGDVETMAVDQSTGDIYAFTRIPGSENSNGVVRLNSDGTPHNFTAGPFAGTNQITGFSIPGDIAFDNSGGPLDGTLYIASRTQQDGGHARIYAYSSTGLPRGVISGTTVPDGEFKGATAIAVDEASGNLFVSGGGTVDGFGRVWRFIPKAGVSSVSDTSYTIDGITPIENGAGQPERLAVFGERLYIVGEKPTSSNEPQRLLSRFDTSSFSPSEPKVAGSFVSSTAVAVDIDETTGELYVDEGSRVAVYDSSDGLLYRFGSAAFLGFNSRAVAVENAPSGASERIYVGEEGEAIGVYGPLAQVPSIGHAELAAFGSDGTASSTFGSLGALAFDQPGNKLYALDGQVPGIYGFEVSAPQAISPLSGFSPLAVAKAGFLSGLAVDSSALPSSGNIYYSSRATGVIHGFDPAGAPLPGFPVDPAVSPGSPAGTPKDLCGAAVDSAGHLWVPNSVTDSVLEYSSSGAFLGALDTSAQGGPCQAVFDADDNLYVGVFGEGLWKFDAAGGYASATRIVPVTGLWGLAVDRSAHRLYAAASHFILEFDEDGTLLSEFATDIPGSDFAGITVDEATGEVYVADAGNKKIRVFAPDTVVPDLSVSAASGVTPISATLNGKIFPGGVALTDCHFEYVTESAFLQSGFSDLSSGGQAPCSPPVPGDLEEHAVSALISGLAPNTDYRFRLVAANARGSAKTQEAGFVTTGPTSAETTGSPVRSATTARLEGRVNPRNVPTQYFFEYGSAGPCGTSPCQATAPKSAGAGGLIRLVSETLSGLTPGTTYHYRLVADNGTPGSPSFGGDMTLTTRADDAPFDHGHLPGPPRSDRNYEQISLPDTGGNPVFAGLGFSDDGNRAIYRVAGGTPVSDTGTQAGLLYAERTSSGWQYKKITPPREILTGGNWDTPVATSDLGWVFTTNLNNTTSMSQNWLMSPEAPPALLLSPSTPQGADERVRFGIAANGSLGVAMLRGEVDPAYPQAANTANLYALGIDGPHLVSLLPGNSVPVCGVGGPSAFGQPIQRLHWISDDGSRVYFPSSGNVCNEPSQLYMRNIAAAETKLISGPSVSGPTCAAGFLKGTSGGVFFWTQSRLAPNDRAPAGCSGSDVDGDVYRYDLGSGDLRCLTCIVDRAANVSFPAGNPSDGGGGATEIAVSDDGSRVYFKSKSRLAAGAPNGSFGLYRLTVSTQALAFVGSIGSGSAGVMATLGNAITPDGSVFLFRSDSAGLNPIGGTDNGTTPQLYRYDDRDRSLICVSCPSDGTPARRNLSRDLIAENAAQQRGPNQTPLSADGETLAFATSEGLLDADQNTSGPGEEPKKGQDVYEWRDGRLMLVTDGLTTWPFLQQGAIAVPQVNGVSPSGRDIYFLAAAQYTADALDGYYRLYDARIGGGFEFPPPPRPCPLEVCQGTPRGAPEEPPPGTSSFLGAGNPSRQGNKPRCPKSKRKVRRGGKVRCVPRKSRHAHKKQKRGGAARHAHHQQRSSR
jgi:hypothetical protein